MTPIRPDEPPDFLELLRRIADSLEFMASELRLRNRAQGIFPE